jgi:hypothetical protein
MLNFPPTRSLAVTAVLLLVASSTVRSQSNGNYCGSTWIDAVSRCAKPCPTGAPTECFGGETCFAGTPVCNCQCSTLNNMHTANEVFCPLFVAVQRSSSRNTTTGSVSAYPIKCRHMWQWSGRERCMSRQCTMLQVCY